MAGPDNYNNDRMLSGEHAELLIRAAKQVGKGVNRRLNGYLDGTYDPKKEAKNLTVRGVTTSLVVLSLLTGLAFAGPADITEEQEAANYRPAPVVMDADEFINAPVDDDDADDADEQKGARAGIIARFRQAVLRLPQSVRVLLAVPLWAAGTAIMTVISFLWNILFSSPLGAFIASLAMGFAIMTGLFAVTAKALFPDVPLRKILCRRNLIIMAGLALLLSVFDALAPAYWHSYPLAAALLKLVAGGTVIGIVSVRIGSRQYGR